jgi:hypothetical protein
MKRSDRRGGPIWPDGLPEQVPDRGQGREVRKRDPSTGDIRHVTVTRVDRDGPGTIIEYHG